MEAQKQHPFPRSSGFWGFRFFARIIGFGGNPQPIQGLRLNNMAIRRSPYFLIRRNNYVNQSDHRLNGIPVGVAGENHGRSQQDTEALLDVIRQEAVPRGYPSLPEGRKLIRAKKRCAWIMNFQILQQQIGTSRQSPHPRRPPGHEGSGFSLKNSTMRKWTNRKVTSSILLSPRTA